MVRRQALAKRESARGMGAVVRPGSGGAPRPGGSAGASHVRDTTGAGGAGAASPRGCGRAARSRARSRSWSPQRQGESGAAGSCDPRRARVAQQPEGSAGRSPGAMEQQAAGGVASAVAAPFGPQVAPIRQQHVQAGDQTASANARTSRMDAEPATSVIVPPATNRPIGQVVPAFQVPGASPTGRRRTLPRGPGNRHVQAARRPLSGPLARRGRAPEGLGSTTAWPPGILLDLLPNGSA
jgi:hypothetical protein